MSKDKEIVAMQEIAEALGKFTEAEGDTLRRVLSWATSRYGGPGMQMNAGSVGAGSDAGNSRREPTPLEFADLAEMYNAASPKTNPERALVSAYWLTSGKGQSAFSGLEVNSGLRDLGHGIGSITHALTSLMDQKPSLVMQIKKSGTTRQARKTYKLTGAGKTKTLRMISGQNDDDN